MSEKITCKKGDVIFKEGSWEMSMYSVRSGKVGIYANYGKEGEKLLTELEEGRLFGEMGLIEARPRSATAVALEDSELEVIDSDGFESFFKEDPEQIGKILAAMTKRVRELSDKYIEVCDVISDYLSAEKSKKKGFWKKLKETMIIDTDYEDIYPEMIRAGYDPLSPRSNFYWY